MTNNLLDLPLFAICAPTPAIGDAVAVDWRETERIGHIEEVIETGPDDSFYTDDGNTLYVGTLYKVRRPAVWWQWMTPEEVEAGRRRAAELQK